MSPLNFAIIALRLTAIYFFVEAISLFTTATLEAAFAVEIAKTPGLPKSPDFSEPLVLLAFLPPVSLLVLGSALFFFALPLARRLIPKVTPEEEKPVCSFEEIQAIIFASVGILILTNSFPGLGHAVMNLFHWYFMPEADRAIASDRVVGDWTHSIGVIAQVAIGLLLVLNPKGFRNLWRYLRTAGTRPRSEIAES
jgi:hypothetical protein